MKKWAIVAGCAVAAAIAIWFTLFRPSEEDRVRKVLDRFAKAVAVKADDNILARTGRLRSELKETVTDDVYVDVSDLNIRVTSRGALVEDATKAGLVFQSADCSLTGMTIKIDDTAERGGERRVEKRPVHFLLRKNDGEWRITTVDVAPARTD
jgi:hypothetical protein